MGEAWTAIDIPCPPSVAEDFAAEIVSAFGAGVEMTGEGIRFYVPEGFARAEWEPKLLTLCRAFGVSEETACWREYEMDSDHWADRWREFFKPLRVGRRFLVTPTWEEVTETPGDLVIRMDPGRAFGTGHHETTRLCIEWLEDTLEGAGEAPVCRREGRRAAVLDVGTGSGILATVAGLLGCAEVLGVDTDPDAVEVARENARLNPGAGAPKFAAGTASDVEGRFEVVVANIHAYPLIGMAGALRERVAPGGRLAVSGILVEQREMVQTAIEAAGLTFIECRTAGEWVLLAFSG